MSGDAKDVKDAVVRPSYVTVDGDDEVVDMAAAATKVNRSGVDEPVFNALLHLLSGEGTELEDFGFVDGDPSTVLFRVRVTVNGRSVSFVDLVTLLYRDRQESVTREAKAMVEDLVGDRMRGVEDDLHSVRDHLREKFQEAWFRPRGGDDDQR